ncbi:MAG: VOC family protein [Treponema sp.]|jgi:catechol 2,3-dioxygenase-like lactoylglutathione lyase family enzyme|nr:VOC family protein [Treponema sp.]
MSIRINGVNHFGISVKDMDESVKWYERVFGFTVVDHSVIPANGVKVCHMQAPGFLLEIFCPSDPLPLPKDRKDPNRDILTLGNKHISYGVSDAHILPEELKKLGVNIVFIAEVDNTYAVYIQDNTGNLIEIFEEVAPNSAAANKLKS